VTAAALQPLREIGQRLQALVAAPATPQDAAALLALGEDVLRHWVLAKGEEPTGGEREGFRLLALHRQGAAGDPSFNACRETCRELAWHYNLLTLRPASEGERDERSKQARMMALVANHLYLFISGKLETEAVGEFCCSSRPLRTGVDAGGAAGSE
jgi:hypothetical protein